MTSLFYATEEALASVYKQASAADMPTTWRNALEKAYDLLLASDLIAIEFAPDGSIHTADIPSQTEPDTVYRVNGQCGCNAGQRGLPCAHRAAKRLLQRCWELSRPVAPAPAPARVTDDLFKPEDDAPSYEIVDRCPDVSLEDLFEMSA